GGAAPRAGGGGGRAGGGGVDLAGIPGIDERLEDVRLAGAGAEVGDGELVLGEDADAEAPRLSDRPRARRLRAERDENGRRVGRGRREGGHGHAPRPEADAAGDEDDAARERAHRV